MPQPPRLATLIGAPSDAGASTRGAALGPDALRIAGLSQVLAARGIDVLDRGNLVGPRSPEQPPVDGYRHLPQVSEWCSAVHDSVLDELSRGRLPILLGGDHSLAMGSIAAAARHCRGTGKSLRVLWLDAHADFNTSDLTPTGNLHGMPVACLCGHGPKPLVELAGAVPAIMPACVRQIGVRCVDPGERRFVHEQGLEVYDMRFIDEEGVRRTVALALEGVDEGCHLHVSIDLDFLDPELAPGVGTPVPGGATYREAQLCMEMIADSRRLASLDIVEVNPILDRANRTARLAVDLVESLFGRSTLMRDPGAR